MRKIYIGVHDCRPGMKVAEDIFNEYGTLVAADGMVLDEHIISRIAGLGFNRIKVYDSGENIIEVSNSDLFRA
ncbi:MAG TPA: hypothetical protein PK127_07365 [Clostridiales bacterium]|nr:hypothetical protein [Clostridiales bacterium]HPV02277.1 hypothetical protein [Clostridiales bacterium]